MSDDSLGKVKELRHRTGAGIQDCKIALSENGYDIEKSIEYLRKKGISKAAKKSSRDAAEGLICISDNDKLACIIEINSETDFVAKNDKFLKFCNEILKVALKKVFTLNELLNEKNNSIFIKDQLVELVSQIGENIKIRRIDYLNKDNFLVEKYIHNPITSNLGKIGVLVSSNSKKKDTKAFDFTKKIGMHIAAMAPIALSENDLDKEFLNKEKEILLEELKNEGKKDNIINKIMTGKLKRVVDDNTLLGQKWIYDNQKSVLQALKEYEKETGDNISLQSFVRFKVGEGVDLKKKSFDEEVKSLAGTV